ncbi:hypothetical protein Ahy_B06g084175 [Arachis hypogaea]|uniref:Uncharacterized protein n=1 Tax=Arachis hypogaea TaxID=3818 RepID=A0A444YRB1_ARAHY|nr:hypothetical protein Ahy_B06g084175 [Arachis hypogaea]
MPFRQSHTCKGPQVSLGMHKFGPARRSGPILWRGSSDPTKKSDDMAPIVCTKMETRTGNVDKVLVEFITDLGRSSENIEDSTRS